MNVLALILFALVTPYQDDSHDNYKVLFCGQTGAGKTLLAKKMILAEKHRWKIILDPDGQYARSFGVAPARNETQLARTLAYSGGVCFDPMLMFHGDMTKAFDWTAEWAWDFAGRFSGNKLLVMDDFPDWTPTNDEKFRAHRLSEISGNGRRRGLDLYALCRFYNEGCPKFTGSFSDIYAFQQPDAQCAQIVARQGFALDRIQALKQGEFLHLNRRAMEVRPGKVAIPRK